MKKLYFLLFALLISTFSFGQVINEVDADTPGSDLLEFVELKHTANTTFGKIAMVFVNGSTNAVYGTIDLEGKTTDANGFYVFGQDALTPKDELLEVSVQNGPDAIALYSYTGDFADFDIAAATLLTSVVHHTGDAPFNASEQILSDTYGPGYDEAENGQKDTQSVQRKDDGTYGTANPTPGAENVFPDPVAPTEVATLKELRDIGVTDGTLYTITGEIVVTYLNLDSNIAHRNQKYVQDATAGILIDDTANRTNGLMVGDGITGLTGSLGEFGGVLQFVPTETVSSASSTTNPVVAVEKTITEIIADETTQYLESVLITIRDVQFADTGVFVIDTDYSISNPDGTVTCRVNFDNENLAGANIPTMTSSVTGFLSIDGSTNTILPRTVSDVEGATLGLNDFETNNFKVYPNPTATGFVNISSANTTAMDVAVYDVLGKQVINRTVNNNRLNVSALNAGVYIMKVSQEGATATKKLVIK